MTPLVLAEPRIKGTHRKTKC